MYLTRTRTLRLSSLIVTATVFATLSVFAQDDSFVPDPEDAALAAAARIGGTVSVGIELVDEPAAIAYHKTLKATGNRGNAIAEAKRQLAQIRREQQRVLQALKHPSINARVIFETQRTFNGFGVYVEADRLDEIRKIPGVASTHYLVPQTTSNAGSVPFIGAPGLWTAGGGSNIGQGIRIGVIDSGIDYLHTHFGGPGSGFAANNPRIIGDAPAFPGTKVVGGWDFAGDSYDAGNADPARRIAAPDPDPIDCASNGHGSHVAGTAAGYGVRADGSTFTGPWDASTQFDALKIGPGVAPAAQLYALRVFGCSGSTLLTAPAIEWSVDPDGDGDFSDRLDVINLSLGAAFGSPTDASATAAQNAALAGVIVVIAAGNSGDTHYIVGSPGTATRAITVAGVQDSGFPAMRVNAPASIAGMKAIGRTSGWGVPLTDPGVTGTVVAASPMDACAPLTNGAQVAGKIVFINRGGTSAPPLPSCGFELKAKLAQDAGAIGVIIGNVSTSANPFVPPGMGTGNIGGVTIPVVSVGLTAANEIRANLGAGISATILRSGTAVLPEVGDLVYTSSSRGIRRVDNALKPDIAAPAVSVDSSLVGTGNGSAEFSGTSMATPHIAGMMAILRQLHPTWSVEELKALAMNSAARDVFLNPSQTPPRYGVARQGAGRADLTAAANTSVIALNDDGDGSVGVSFGSVEVVGSFNGTRTIRVVNKGATSETYNVSLFTTQDVPGASYALPDGNTVTVGPGQSATLRVQLNATALGMRHSRDTTMSATQTNTGGTVLNRIHMSEESAYVVLTPSAGPTIRVPVHAIVRPASNMRGPASYLLAGASGTRTIALTGTDVNTGGSSSTDERSLVSAFELAGTDGDDTAGAHPSRRAADIKAVGVTSDFVGRGNNLGASTIYFGIAAHGSWTSLLDVEFDVYIDRNRDGVDDVVFFNTTQSSGNNRIDVHGTSVLALPASTTVPGSVFTFINGVNHSIHTVPYNNNVIVLPARAADLGLSAANSRFNYRIVSFARGFSTSVDTFTGTYDPQLPGVNFHGAGMTGAPIFTDFNGFSIATQYNAASFAANSSQGVLLLHHHNAQGNRDQIVAAATPQSTAVSVAAASAQYSDVVTLTAAVTPATNLDQTIVGTVQFAVDGVAVGSAPVSSSGVASLSYVVTVPSGAHSVAATFNSSNAYFLGSSGSGTLTVVHENAAVTPSTGNPASAQVSAPGGTAASVTLAASIAELPDGSAGNVGFASPVTVTLTPIGPGSVLTQTATLSVDGAALAASATFLNVPVNVYEVSFAIGGAYYTGSAESVLAVFDPSLGNVTGGGTIVRNGVRANFGINVKYQKNGNAQGQVLYVEHRAGGPFRVKSNSLSTLSITGGTAIILGKATLDGSSGNHDFQLIVVDNGEPGSADQLGLKVTDRNGNEIPDLTFAPVTLTGGNVQVPK